MIHFNVRSTWKKLVGLREGEWLLVPNQGDWQSRCSILLLSSICSLISELLCLICLSWYLILIESRCKPYGCLWGTNIFVFVTLFMRLSWILVFTINVVTLLFWLRKWKSLLLTSSWPKHIVRVDYNPTLIGGLLVWIWAILPSWVSFWGWVRSRCHIFIWYHC